MKKRNQINNSRSDTYLSQGRQGKSCSRDFSGLERHEIFELVGQEHVQVLLGRTDHQPDVRILEAGDEWTNQLL